jgi:hypothetical protein
MDWNQVGTDLVMASIKYLLPILISAVIAWVGLLIKNEWESIKAKRPDIIKLVMEYAPILVGYIEMERKKGTIDLLSIKAQCEVLIVDFLKTKGVELNFSDPIWALIWTVVEAEVRKLPKFTFGTDK